MEASLLSLFHVAIPLLNDRPLGQSISSKISIFKRVTPFLMAVSRATRSLVLHRFVADTQDPITQVLWLKQHTVFLHVTCAEDVVALRALVADVHTVTFDGAPVEAYKAAPQHFPRVTALRGVELTPETAPYIAAMTHIETLHCTNCDPLSLRMITGLSRLSSLHCNEVNDSDEFLMCVAGFPLLVDLDFIVASPILKAAGRDALAHIAFRKHLTRNTCATLARIIGNTFQTETSKHLVDTDVVRGAVRCMLENSIAQGTLVETLSITSAAYPIQEFVKCFPKCMEACVAVFPPARIEAAPPIHAIDRLSPILTTILSQSCPDLVPHLTTIQTRKWLMTNIEVALMRQGYRAAPSVPSVLLIFGMLLSCGPDLKVHFSTDETREWLMGMIKDAGTFGIMLDEFSSILCPLFQCCPELRAHFSTPETRDWVMSQIDAVAQNKSRNVSLSRRLRSLASILETLLSLCPDLRTHWSSPEARCWLVEKMDNANPFTLGAYSAIHQALLKYSP